MGDESDILAAGASWLRSLLNKPEKEIVILLHEDPDLLKQKISLTCLGQLKLNENPECECSRKLETLQGHEGQRTEDLLTELHTSIILGVCPHVLSILQNYDGTHLPSESTAIPEVQHNVYETITRLFKKHKNSPGIDVNHFPTELGECSVRSHMLKSLIPYSCTASITAVHVVTALGKCQLLREILSDRLTPVGSLCLHFETGYHSMSPYHIAVLHRNYKVIDILRKNFPRMAGNMDRHFGRENITPSTLAAKMNDVTALEHLLKEKHFCSSMNSKALLISLENRSMDCAEFLVKRNHTKLESSFLNKDISDIFDTHISNPVVNLLKDLIWRQSDRDFLKLIVDYGCVPAHFVVSTCIYFDATETTKYLLESTKACSVPKLSMFNSLLNLATLKNSPTLLSVLIQYVRPKYYHLDKVCSALYWAKMLHYDECINILEKPLYSVRRLKERIASDIATTPPFPAILLEAKFVKFDLIGTVKKLKELGYDINAAISTGMTCLSIATDQKNTVRKYGTVVSLLLELGADVFATRMYYVRGQEMYPPMLLRMLVANVDLCGPYTAQFQSSRTNIMSLLSREMQLLVLRTAHSIGKDDVEFLRTKLKEGTDVEGRFDKTYQDLFDHLNEYIDNPQSLRRLCRNCIRKTTGIHLHKFLKSQQLPNSLVDMLTLKYDLEPYWESCKVFTDFWRDNNNYCLL